jgi:hypothetical protein
MISEYIESDVILDYVPNSFRIGNQEFKVILCDELYYENDSVYGLFSYEESTIKINIRKMCDKSLCGKEQILNTLWHEIFHAFNFLYDNTMSESVAQVFANFMREFDSSKKYKKVENETENK